MDARTSAAPSLPSSLRLGAAHLVVAELDRAVAWYQDALGLRVLHRDVTTAAVGADAPALVLHERPGARRAARHAGLYHVALLLPSREELARAALRLAATGTPIEGASDHGTHEAIYLPDADGNGLELAADRPRAQWPAHLGYATGPSALDLDGLLRTVAGEEPQPRAGDGLRVGHLHLHVGDIERALAFYRDLVGFELMAHIGSAAFVAAGGYHHHLAVNVWRGEGVPPAPEDAVGLAHWTVELPAGDVERLRGRLAAAGAPLEEDGSGGLATRDPWGIALRVLPLG